MDGDLVASLTPRERMDMIQHGYVPGHEEDVIRYRQGQKPTGEAVGLATLDTGGGFSLNFLGEKNVKGRFNFDQADPNKEELYKRTYEIDSFEGEIENQARETENVDPRVSIKERMNNYSTNSSLDAKISTLMNRTQQSSNKTTQPQLRKPLVTSRSVLKEEKVLADGYSDGAKYLNAFIKLLKSPTQENRETLIESINNFIIVENNLPTQLLKVYRKGLSNAESKMYEHLKKVKK